VQVRRKINLGLVVELLDLGVILDPSVVEHLLDRDTITRTFSQGNLNELDGLVGDVLQQTVVRLVELNVLVHAILGRVIWVSPIVEGRRTRQQNVRNDSSRPTVDLKVVSLFLD